MGDAFVGHEILNQGWDKKDLEDRIENHPSYQSLSEAHKRKIMLYVKNLDIKSIDRSKSLDDIAGELIIKAKFESKLDGGRRRTKSSKKAPTSRRRRSSKRKARKARTTRRKY